MRLVHEQTASFDLAVFDHYIRSPEPNGREPGPGKENDIQWRTLTGLLVANLCEATDLWNREMGEPARTLRQDLVRAGRSQAAIAMLRENSYHALVLAVARVIVDPKSHASVPQDAIDRIGPGQNGKPLPAVVRVRLVREMITSLWPADTTRELEREHVAAQELDRVQPGSLPAPTDRTQSRFARKPDAKHLCLEALANVPNGIPIHQDIADATELQLPTVKEAMAKLSKAGFVEKTDGAWRITPKGRDHLKQLRGE